MPRLTRYFTTDEVPGWHHYSAADRAVASEVVRTFLTPIRRRWGTILLTDAMTREHGAHTDPGTFDWVPMGHLLEIGALELDNRGNVVRRDPDAIRRGLIEVGDWVATHYAGAFGELLVEPPPWGGDVTGHLHSTRPGVGSPGAGEYLIQVGRDRWEFGGSRPDLLTWLVLLGTAALALPAL